jgi:methylation protein EvaC
MADQIVAQYGHADAVLSANVICHIPSLPSVAAGVQRLLTPDGLFIFRRPLSGRHDREDVVRPDL